MTKKTPHAADVADFAKIASAKKFIASLFIGVGRFAKAEAPTLERARALGQTLVAEHKSLKRASVYAIDARGKSMLVPDSYVPGKAEGYKGDPAAEGRAAVKADDEARAAKPAKAKQSARLKAGIAKSKAAAKAAKAEQAAKPEPKAKPAKPAGERKDGLRPGSKMAIAVDMVCAKKGATCPEIATALGWTVLNSSTLKRFCEGAKVKLREDADEKPTRFFGTARA